MRSLQLLKIFTVFTLFTSSAAFSFDNNNNNNNNCASCHSGSGAPIDDEDNDSQVGYGVNLLENPNGYDGTASWTITNNGGNGWQVLPDGDGFRASFNWAERQQVVDLLDKGYSQQILDKQPPIIISERFYRTYCNDTYYLAADLLDTNMQVVDTWSSGHLTHTGDGCDDNYYEQIEHEFTQYGPGVRYVRWRDGGTDGESWSGHYGPILVNPILAVLPVNLLDNPGSLSSWDILQNGGNGWLEASNGIMRTSYEWASREQEIDLINDMGYSAQALDNGYPILASESFIKVSCPDQYYLKVELLNANKDIIESFDSGVITHDRPRCANENYAERLVHTFTDYAPGVRYIRWEDGSKDTGFSKRGHYGASLAKPYLGMFDLATDITPLPDNRRRLSVTGWVVGAVDAVVAVGVGAACVFTLTVACGPAILAGGIVIYSANNLYIYEHMPDVDTPYMQTSPPVFLSHIDSIGGFSQRQNNSWWRNKCTAPFQLDDKLGRCLCPAGQYPDHLAGQQNEANFCSTTNTGKVQFINSDPNFYERDKPANNDDKVVEQAHFKNTRASNPKLTTNSKIALRNYKNGTCFTGIVTLEIPSRVIVFPVNGDRNDLTYYRCRKQETKPGSQYTDASIPQENFSNHEYLENGRLTIDWNKKWQAPSHITLSESLSLIDEDDDINYPKRAAVGFFMQKIDENTFVLDYNSRSLHKAKFKYKGKTDGITRDTACGNADLALPRCYPSLRWRTTIINALEDAFKPDN